MSETTLLVFSLLAGMLLGMAFFGGLWWTVQKGVASKNPALLFGASLWLRTGMVMGGFYFVSGGDWKRLLACLAGFVIARLIITRLTVARMDEEASHAP